MGGYGSGRWQFHEKKLTVEECMALDCGKLVRDGLIAREPGSGSLTWHNVRTQQKTGSVSFYREVLGDQVIFRLRYDITRQETKQDINEPIPLETTPLHWGGVRWWFRCPLVIGGKPCRRRVSKLYLPPGGLYFGCRHCYDLTYTSSQESHQWDRLYALIGQEMGLDTRSVGRILKHFP